MFSKHNSLKMEECAIRWVILFILIICLGLLMTPSPAKTEVLVSSVAQLETAINSANSGGDANILVADGTYVLNNLLHITADNITVRGQSGNRDAVILRGQDMDGGVSHVFLVRGSHFTVRDMTIGWVANHGIQIQGEQGASHVTMSNLRVADCFEQLIKVSYNAASPNSSTHGVLEDSLLEYTAGVGPQYYIGGIDAHQARNWTVRRNIFKNIASPSDSLAEHAVHFWSGSEDTLVEANLIIDCDRGIGFGLGERGHVRGVIRNNMIHHGNRNTTFADVGIDLQSSTGTMVYNNTIFFQNDYPNAIEYRFAATTGAYIANNLTNRAISARDGASGTLSHNLTTAQAGWFVSATTGDLHLASAVSTVVDQGTADIPGLPSPFLDFDGKQRPTGSGIDIGAHEFGAPAGDPWHSEVGVINADGAAFSGILYGFDAAGAQVWNQGVNLDAFGRLELDVAAAAGDNASQIKSMRLDITSGQAVGYQKFYQSEKYRVGLEASPQPNMESLYVPHIASDNTWWTGIGWTNTTNTAKSLQFTFDTGQQAEKQLVAGGHEAFTIASMFDNSKQPEIGAAQVTNGGGMVGLMLFGGENVLSGVNLSDATTSTLYFPHVAHDSEWWTGLVVYNPGTGTADLTLTYFDAQGGQLGANNTEVGPGQRMVGSPDTLDFPAGTEWFMAQASQPITGFELFGTTDTNQLGGYSVVNLAASSGVFPKLERDGWTGIAFVNPGETANQVRVQARNDAGVSLAENTVTLNPGQKWVNQAEVLFSGQDISAATYIIFSSSNNLIAFQLNGSTDGTMLDAIPALGGAHTGTQQLYFPHIEAE